jgi:tetratricopeptide (TPR) repeat protein
MATFNSAPSHAPKCKLAATIVVLAAMGIAFAGEALNKIFAARAEVEFHRAQIEFQSNTNASAIAWEFARACFDFADFATNDAERVVIARQGIAACRQLIVREPESAPAHYYLAMDLGQLARTKTLGALKIVREIEREFKTAAGLDGHFDYAGPARSLGLLYRDAPDWPFSIGSKRRARDFLERAVKLAPDYPENHLNLVESYLQWHDQISANRELGVLDMLWPGARTNFVGEAWERSWDDWSARRDAARKRLSEIPKPLNSPKNNR